MQNQKSNPTNMIRTHWSHPWKKLIIAIMGGIVGLNLLTGCQDSKPTATPDTKPSPTASSKPSAEKKTEKPTEPKTTTDKKTPTDNKTTPEKLATEADKTKDEPDKAGRRRKKDINYAGTDATIIGGSGSKNIRSGPGTDYKVLHIAYPGDRVKFLETRRDEDMSNWHKVYFPKTGAEGWITSSLLRQDAGRVTPEEPDPTPVRPKPTPIRPIVHEDVHVREEDHRFNDGTNATINGSNVNIRSGPGTYYDSPHMAYSGDRVIMSDAADDADGYTWYYVYFPKSGADGWIAGHLLSLD